MRHLNILILLLTYIVTVPLTFIVVFFQSGIREGWESAISVEDDLRKIYFFYSESNLLLNTNGKYWEFRKLMEDREDVLHYLDDIDNFNMHIAFFSEGRILFLPWKKPVNDKEYLVDEYKDQRK